MDGSSDDGKRIERLVCPAWDLCKLWARKSCTQQKGMLCMLRKKELNEI